MVETTKKTIARRARGAHAIVQSAKRVAKNLEIAIGGASKAGPLQAYFLTRLRDHVVGEFLAVRRCEPLTNQESLELLLEQMDQICARVCRDDPEREIEAEEPLLSDTDAEAAADEVIEFFGGTQLGALALGRDHLVAAAKRWNIKKQGRLPGGQHGKYEHLRRALEAADPKRWKSLDVKRLEKYRNAAVARREVRLRELKNGVGALPVAVIRAGDDKMSLAEIELEERAQRIKEREIELTERHRMIEDARKTERSLRVGLKTARLAGDTELMRAIVAELRARRSISLVEEKWGTNAGGNSIQRG